MSVPASHPSGRSSQLERLTRAEERASSLQRALDSMRGEFKDHAKEVLGALKELRDESLQRKAARSRDAVWTGAVVAVVTFVSNILVKLI